jgi:mannitol/fructose-specific phosphotransferase system IIA component (Ntr-type)
LDLTHLLTIDTIAVNVSAADWRDVVRKVGRLLVDSGGVEERYIDGMIRTAEDLGPYIVVAPGIAMPHSRPEDGVIHSCMALMTLSEPIEFGNAENDPVRLVFAFGAVDNEQHVEALREMATVLGRFYDELGGIEALLKAETEEGLLQAILEGLPEGEPAAE